MPIRIVRSARRHKLSARRIREALLNAVQVRMEDDAAVYVGSDAEGVEIEMVVIPDDHYPGGFTVIHAMPWEWRKR